MADVINITDGTTSIPLILDADGFQMLANGGEFGVAEHDNIYHESGYESGEMLVRHRVKNKTWPMKLAVRGSTDDDIIGSLRTLLKMAAQARSYHLSANMSKVYLSIKLDSATYTTYYDVLDIEPKGVSLFSYMNRNAQELLFDDGLAINIVTSPYGYGDMQTLENELDNPHFEEGGVGNMAHGWQDWNTPSVSEISSTVARVGSYSMKITASAGDGVISDTFYNGTSTYFAGFAYIYNVDATAITVDVYDVTATSVRDTENANAATTGEWQKVEVSGTFTAGHYISLRIYGNGGTFYIDQTYVQIGSSAVSVPLGWASGKNIHNHYDDDEDHLNYIDLADIPGDVDAVTKIYVYPDSTDPSSPTIWIGKRSRETIYKSFALESAVSKYVLSKHVTGQTNYSYDEYNQYSQASNGAWATVDAWEFAAGTSILDWGWKFAVIAVGGIFDTGTYFKVQYQLNGLTVEYETAITEGSGLGFQEMGIIEIPPGYTVSDGNLSAFDIAVLIYNNSGVTSVFNIDYIQLFPLDGYRIIKQTSYGLVQYTPLVDDGFLDRVYTSDVADTRKETSINFGLGDRITLSPLTKERLIFLWEDGGAYDPALESHVKIDYIPRTEFLL